MSHTERIAPCENRNKGPAGATSPVSGSFAVDAFAPPLYRGNMSRPSAPHSRRVFCNRLVDLTQIDAIGYDMDYTLVHYHVDAYEKHAYEYIKRRLAASGWPLSRLKFDPDTVIRGLVLDVELGNILKVNRSGFVKQAAHGAKRLPAEETRRLYARTLIDVDKPRFHILTTLFALSEGCLYAQLVDLFDKGRLPGAASYADLHRRIRTSTDRAYFEGELKPKILAHPERFIVADAEAPQALLDQKAAGKKLMLITNSDWHYTNAVLTYAYGPHLPRGMKWRDLFEIVIVSADKPAFFASPRPLYEVVDEARSRLSVSVRGLRSGITFWGGNAALVEKRLGVDGDRILYVGDHIIGDCQVSKSVLRWRTALVLRELEEEIAVTDGFARKAAVLDQLMSEKEAAEAELASARLAGLRARKGRQGPTRAAGMAPRSPAALRRRIAAIDARVAPLARAAGALGNPRWGLLMRSGNEKSLFARMVENYADLYFSRVANFLAATPFLRLRSFPGSLPHD